MTTAAVAISFIAAAVGAAIVWHFLGAGFRRRLGRPEGTLVAVGLSLLNMGATWVLAIWVLTVLGVWPRTEGTGFPWWALLVSVAMLGSSIRAARHNRGDARASDDRGR